LTIFTSKSLKTTHFYLKNTQKTQIHQKKPNFKPKITSKYLKIPQKPHF
jgi:hypothetical protein